MTARILDRGYRRYGGERRGVGRAVATLVLHTIYRALGLRRSGWAKVLPVLVVAISYVPAIVFVGIVALLPDDALTDLVLPSYGEYFGFIASAVILFVAFVAPEVLCPDRRTGMLGLYLASPLSRDTYLAAKALAVSIVLAFVTVGPPLLMLVASVLQGEGPDGPGSVALTLSRIVGAGLAITALFTAVSLAASSLTDRKAFAAAGLILLFLVTGAVAGVLVTVADDESFALLSLRIVPFELVIRIHGETGGEAQGMSTAAVAAANVAWTLAGAALARIRYQALTVTR